jgi:iron complex transport system permease protein
LAGAIGFVGLVAPHVVRGFVSHDPARTLIPAGLLGALIVALADIAVRSIPTMIEIRLGVLTALIGAPFFLLIAMRKGHLRHD